MKIKFLLFFLISTSAFGAIKDPWCHFDLLKLGHQKQIEGTPQHAPLAWRVSQDTEKLKDQTRHLISYILTEFYSVDPKVVNALAKIVKKSIDQVTKNGKIDIESTQLQSGRYRLVRIPDIRKIINQGMVNIITAERISVQKEIFLGTQNGHLYLYIKDLRAPSEFDADEMKLISYAKDEIFGAGLTKLVSGHSTEIKFEKLVSTDFLTLSQRVFDLFKRLSLKPDFSELLTTQLNATVNHNIFQITYEKLQDDPIEKEIDRIVDPDRSDYWEMIEEKILTEEEWLIFLRKQIKNDFNYLVIAEKLKEVLHSSSPLDLMLFLPLDVGDHIEITLAASIELDKENRELLAANNPKGAVPVSDDLQVVLSHDNSHPTNFRKRQKFVHLLQEKLLETLTK